jgi:hypothetical protein
MHSQVQKASTHKYPPPLHSDLCSPTAYATREMRYGHIPGSGACLDLPVPHSISPVQIRSTYVNFSGHSPCVEREHSLGAGTHLEVESSTMRSLGKGAQPQLAYAHRVKKTITNDSREFQAP